MLGNLVCEAKPGGLVVLRGAGSLLAGFAEYSSLGFSDRKMASRLWIPAGIVLLCVLRQVVTEDAVDDQISPEGSDLTKLVEDDIVLAAEKRFLTNLTEIGADGQKQAQAMAFQWLLAHRDTNWGWFPNTPEVLYAMWSTNFTTTSGFLQSTKQLEIELVLELCRGLSPNYPDRFLMESVLALSSLCINTENFHGYKLMETLNLDFITNRNFSAFSRTRIMYAACVGGIPIPARSVQELLNEVAAYPNNIHTYDTVAQVAMLLQCVLKNAESESVAEAVSGILDDLVLNLTKAADNLNFLSDTSVSLIVQALMCVPDREGHKAALLEPFQKRMLQNQKADGAYDDNVLTTAHILTGLARVCLLDLRSQHCDFNGDTPTEPPGFDVDRGNETVVLVSANFTIWIGLTVELAYSKIVTLRENSTMYQLMRIAAENDPRFEFAAYDFPWGRYIHNIGGIELQHEGYHYWLMYTLPFPPDPKNPPPTSFIGADGVDDLVIKDGMNILFWNKPI